MKRSSSALFGVHPWSLGAPLGMEGKHAMPAVSHVYVGLPLDCISALAILPQQLHGILESSPVSKGRLERMARSNGRCVGFLRNVPATQSWFFMRKRPVCVDPRPNWQVFRRCGSGQDPAAPTPPESQVFNSFLFRPAAPCSTIHSTCPWPIVVVVVIVVAAASHVIARQRQRGMAAQ